jgi:hypothetical protein
MASEMVERVARTLWADADDFDFDTRGPETQKRIRNRARLAIAAMREPTQAMLEAVKPFPEHLRAEHPDPGDVWHEQMRLATIADQALLRSEWQRMIEAALSD